MRKRTPVERLVRGGLIALALAWSAIPILLVVLSSFKEASQIFEVPPALVFRPTLDNYRALWNERPEFFRALRDRNELARIGAVHLQSDGHSARHFDCCVPESFTARV